MGYFKMNSANPASDIAAGKAIIDVSTSVYRNESDSAWVPFITDTKKWIFDRGYRYHHNDGTLHPAHGGKPAGYAPDDLEIVAVHDSEKRMHVRVPWHGNLTNVQPGDIPATETYSGGFPTLLARYFMRSCR